MTLLKHKMQNIGNKSAFPGLGSNGITYREWLVGRVLQGFCANPVLNNDATDPSFISYITLQQVDKMLEYLQKESDTNDA